MDTNILNQFFYKVKVKDKIVLNYFCEYSLCTIWYKVWRTLESLCTKICCKMTFWCTHLRGPYKQKF